MAHRGRLNVLANIVGKSYGQIFNEFEGYVDPSSTHGSGDVKYHLGADGKYKAADGTTIPVSLVANPSHLEAVDPVLEGVVRAKQDVHRHGRARVHRAARADPRRRGVRRPGRGRRDAGAVPAARLPHRRHRAHRGEQPGRLHHRPDVLPVQHVQHRRRPHDPGADLPRQRRRPRGRGPGRQAGLRLPAGVRQGRRHRHGLLPPPRPQRGRQPLVHPADDVRPDRRQAVDPQALHRVADRPGRHHARRGRAHPARVPGRARAGVHRDPRGPAPAARAGRRAAQAAGPAQPGRPRDRRPRSPRRWSSGSSTPS